jgi:excisionase family DNA binding protein/PAS domain S-box-containing protein
MEKTLFSTPEVAQWLGVFHTTVRRWIERGEIKGIRVGRNYKIPVDEVVRVLDTYSIPLPETLRRYKLKRKKASNGIPGRMDRSSSILQKLLIVEEIEDPALVCRNDLILGANQAFSELTGFSQADLIGLDIADVMDKSSKGRLTEFAQSRTEHSAGGPLDYTAHLKTGKKETKRARITVGSLDHMKGVFLLIMKVW